jgi:hypothetical protein
MTSTVRPRLPASAAHINPAAEHNDVNTVLHPRIFRME